MCIIGVCTRAFFQRERECEVSETNRVREVSYLKRYSIREVQRQQEMFQTVPS